MSGILLTVSLSHLRLVPTVLPIQSHTNTDAAVFHGRSLAQAARDVTENTGCDLYESTQQVLLADRRPARVIYRMIWQYPDDRGTCEVGFLWVEPKQSLGMRLLEITHLHVYPQHRRQGIGTYALRAAAKIAAEMRCDAVESYSTASNIASYAAHTVADYKVLGTRWLLPIKSSN